MFGEKTTTSKSTSSSPTSTPSKPSSPQTMTPRHAELEASYPAAFFGKKPTKSAMVSEKERRDSVSSTATTATSSSVTSSATTLAPSKTAVPEKPFDVFEYQTAGYLSMPMTHESQPYLQGQPSERKSSASSSSSAGSLWSKAKNKMHRKSPSVEEQEKKEQERQERKKEYEALGLEEKVKFGTKGGMRLVE
ncbi:hypothetical protein KCU98_g10524, partial [Aureobasidium melanogenum]